MNNTPQTGKNPTTTGNSLNGSIFEHQEQTAQTSPLMVKVKSEPDQEMPNSESSQFFTGNPEPNDSMNITNSTIEMNSFEVESNGLNRSLVSADYDETCKDEPRTP